MEPSIKSMVQFGIRSAHARWLSRELPDQIGIYMHNLEQSDYERFREAVGLLRDHGYEFVDAERFVAPGTDKRVYLSFDDNYVGWFEGLVLMESLDLSVTFYVNTACFRDVSSPDEIQRYYDRLEFDGRRVPLSTSELRALASAGHQIGAHSHSHYRLSALPFEEATRDIRRGKEELEAILGGPVDHFSYPFGMRRHYSEALRNYCMDLGFSTVANAIPGMQHAQQTRSGLNRSPWDLDETPQFNLLNLKIDGRHFSRLTGRSAVG